MLTGCGTSLYGEQGLDLLVGEEPPSVTLAWELRWSLGEGEGLRVGCGLEGVEPSDDQDGLPFGFLDVPPLQLTLPSGGG